ncbi:unnamed protein product [Schistosoma margrebowiei]|uniref:Uncharacterized protein n=1 Tax=Schistosoma margrebowiei TaxID=48269 RepID=A0A183LMM8_9TREM|nr:unnamed protein product [Schistosoma margrebowiei]
MLLKMTTEVSISYHRESKFRQIDPPDFKKGDIIIDGQPANAPYAEKRDSSVRSWVSSFTSKKLIVNNGEVRELQKRVVREADGTEVHTTIERSSDGEKKHVIYMRPDGQQSQTANSEDTRSLSILILRYTVLMFIVDLLIMDPSVPSMKEYQSENKSSGILDALRRWYYGN